MPAPFDRPILDVAVVSVLAGDEAGAEPAAHPLVKGGKGVAVPVLGAADRSVRRFEGVPARPEERRQLLDERAVLGPARRDALLGALAVAGVEVGDKAREEREELVGILGVELHPVPRPGSRREAEPAGKPPSLAGPAPRHLVPFCRVDDCRLDDRAQGRAPLSWSLAAFAAASSAAISGASFPSQVPGA